MSFLFTRLEKLPALEDICKAARVLVSGSMIPTCYPMRRAARSKSLPSISIKPSECSLRIGRADEAECNLLELFWLPGTIKRPDRIRKCQTSRYDPIPGDRAHKAKAGRVIGLSRAGWGFLSPLPTARGVERTSEDVSVVEAKQLTCIGLDVETSG